jgi:hypothetical protein
MATAYLFPHFLAQRTRRRHNPFLRASLELVLGVYPRESGGVKRGSATGNGLK